MDLSSLSTTLQSPSSSDARLDAEQALTRDFRAAALVLTQFYKSSLHTSNQAYSAGYKACLEEIQGHIQASLSVPHHGVEGDESNSSENAGRTLGRLMDWIEARQEAFKLQAEDEQEDQQREQQAHRSKCDNAAQSSSSSSSKAAASASQQQQRSTSAAAGPSSSRAPSPPTEAEAMEESTGSLRSELSSAAAQQQPSVRSKQRDALVEAVNRARSRNTPDVDEVTPNAATLDDDAPNQESQEIPTPSSLPAHMLSSPLHSPANSHRMRSQSHHHGHGLRDSSRNKDRSKGNSKINFSLPINASATFSFAPSLESTESLPMFPFLSGSDSETVSVGSKRSYDTAVQSGGTNRTLSHERIGALTRKDRRKSHHGHAAARGGPGGAGVEGGGGGGGGGGGARGSGMGMDTEMVDDGDPSDERERKRSARRS